MSYCVYKHTVPNGKIYIGRTKQDPTKRWCNGHGYKANKIFFNDIILYGWINIKHEILYEGLSEREARDKEAELIYCHKSYVRSKGYNVQQGAKYGYLDSIEIRMTRDEYKQYCKTKEFKSKCRARAKNNKIVYQYDNEGNFVARYSSQREAERLTGASHYGIRDCIKGKYKSYKGFIWSDSPPVCEVTDD